jgi:hypothetical protein
MNSNLTYFFVYVCVTTEFPSKSQLQVCRPEFRFAEALTLGIDQVPETRPLGSWRIGFLTSIGLIPGESKGYEQVEPWLVDLASDRSL